MRETGIIVILRGNGPNARLRASGRTHGGALKSGGWVAIAFLHYAGYGPGHNSLRRFTWAQFIQYQRVSANSPRL